MSGESKRLTVHNASVTTMSVEVKTLTIGARQVTQGIFRQLIEEPLIAEDGTLNGVPWGHVTWHPDRCDDAKTKHWHVVWQKGDELRRSWIDVRPPFDREPGRHGFKTATTDSYLTALVREACHSRAAQPLSDNDNAWASLDNPHGVPAWGTASPAARKAASLGFRIRKLIEDVERPLGAYAILLWPAQRGRGQGIACDAGEVRAGRNRSRRRVGRIDVGLARNQRSL